jgi:hypothetical protein
VLLQRFREAAQVMPAADAQVYLDTLSVAGQSVEAVIPVHAYDEAQARLRELAIRLDPVRDLQIVSYR